MSGFVAMLLAPAAVTPTSNPPRDVAPLLAILGSAGLGTPVGYGGLALEAYAGGIVGLALGVGAGSRSPQLAAMFRARVPGDPVAFSIGAGLSAGPYTWRGAHACLPACSAANRGGRTWERAVWANLETAFEGVTDGRYLWRVFFGLAGITNVQASVCDPEIGCAGNPGLIPYVGVSFGRSLW